MARLYKPCLGVDLLTKYDFQAVADLGLCCCELEQFETKGMAMVVLDVINRRAAQLKAYARRRADSPPLNEAWLKPLNFGLCIHCGEECGIRAIPVPKYVAQHWGYKPSKGGYLCERCKHLHLPRSEVCAEPSELFVHSSAS